MLGYMVMMSRHNKVPAPVGPFLVFIQVLLLLMPSVAWTQTDLWEISAEQWLHPRSGASLVKMTPLASVIREMNSDQRSTLTIQYPGGEDGVLWANELRDWLVSLGMPSKRIRTRSGQSSHEKITLVLQKSGEK